MKSLLLEETSLGYGHPWASWCSLMSPTLFYILLNKKARVLLWSLTHANQVQQVQGVVWIFERAQASKSHQVQKNTKRKRRKGKRGLEGGGGRSLWGKQIKGSLSFGPEVWAHQKQFRHWTSHKFMKVVDSLKLIQAVHRMKWNWQFGNVALGMWTWQLSNMHFAKCWSELC